MAKIVRTGPTSADFVQGSLRKYDAWGNSRLNSAPSGFHGYCGNLGHKEDPESGLTYMRARYYEPGTGRFLSEDPARDGVNWYGYCAGNPVDRIDFTGKVHHLVAAFIIGFIAAAVSNIVYQLGTSPHGFFKACQEIVWKDVLVAGIAGGIAGLLLAVGGVGLTALGAAMESQFISGIGGVFFALSTSVSGLTMGEILFGSACGGVLAGVVALLGHIFQLQIAIKAAEEPI